MAKDYSYIMCMDKNSNPNCLYCRHSIPHEGGSECLERKCDNSPYAFTWCKPTKARPGRIDYRVPRPPIYINYRFKEPIKSVGKAYQMAGLDVQEIDPSLTLHEQIAELRSKLSGGGYFE